jgi:predicted PurR-regulated permease PerM
MKATKVNLYQQKRKTRIWQLIFSIVLIIFCLYVFTLMSEIKVLSDRIDKSLLEHSENILTPHNVRNSHILTALKSKNVQIREYAGMTYAKAQQVMILLPFAFLIIVLGFFLLRNLEKVERPE